MEQTNYSELCEWLRKHSSGIYRPSALAADVIEDLYKTAWDNFTAYQEIDNYLISEDLLVTPYEGGPKEASMNTVESIRRIVEENKRLKNEKV